MSSTIIRELALNLAKVIFMLKYLLKLCRFLLCCCVAACHGTVCVLRTASHNTRSSQCTILCLLTRSLPDSYKQPNHLIQNVSDSKQRFSRLCMPSTNRAIQPILLEVHDTGVYGHENSVNWEVPQKICGRLNCINPLNAELNSICKSQLAKLFCGVFKFCA